MKTKQPKKTPYVSTRALAHPVDLKGSRPPGQLDWEALVRYFGGLEIRNAKSMLHVQIIPSDSEGAIPNDPMCCLFGRGTSRQTGGKALFYNTVAYVELKDSNGKSYVARYSIPLALRRYIRDYDENKLAEIVSVGFDLLVPRTDRAGRKKANKNYQSRKRAGLVKAIVRAPARTSRVLSFLKAMSSVPANHAPVNGELP